MDKAHLKILCIKLLKNGQNSWHKSWNNATFVNKEHLNPEMKKIVYFGTQNRLTHEHTRSKHIKIMTECWEIKKIHNSLPTNQSDIQTNCKNKQNILSAKSTKKLIEVSARQKGFYDIFSQIMFFFGASSHKKRIF